MYLQNNPQANLMPCNRGVVRSVGTGQHNSNKKHLDINNTHADKHNNSLVLKQQKPKVSQRVQTRVLPNQKDTAGLLPPIPLTGSNKHNQSRKQHQQSPENHNTQNESIWSEHAKSNHDKDLITISNSRIQNANLKNDIAIFKKDQTGSTQ